MLWKVITFLLVVQFAQYASAALLGMLYTVLRLFWKQRLSNWRQLIRERKGLFSFLFVFCELLFCFLQLFFLWMWCRFFTLPYLPFLLLTILLQLGEAIWKYRSVMLWAKKEAKCVPLLYKH